MEDIAPAFLQRAVVQVGTMGEFTMQWEELEALLTPLEVGATLTQPVVLVARGLECTALVLVGLMPPELVEAS